MGQKSLSYRRYYRLHSFCSVLPIEVQRLRRFDTLSTGEIQRSSVVCFCKIFYACDSDCFCPESRLAEGQVIPNGIRLRFNFLPQTFATPLQRSFTFAAFASWTQSTRDLLSPHA